MPRTNFIRSKDLFQKLIQSVRHCSGKLHNHSFVRVMSSYEYTTHLERTEKSTRQKEMTSATVIACSDLSPTVKSIKLKVTNPKFDFKAGQWVDFFIPGLSTVGGFSMTSSPMQLKKSRTLDLAIKCSKYAPADWVHNKCKIGDTVEMKVGGDFFYEAYHERDEVDLLLIAGGVGVNPVYSIISQISHLRTDGQLTGVRKVMLLYSAKTMKELLFKENIQKLANEMDEFSFHFHVTTENSHLQTSESNFKEGRITNQHIQSIISDLNQSSLHCYICGPPPMIESVVSSLTGLGQPTSRIHYEKWW